MAILQAKAEAQGLPVNNDVAFFLASNIKSNVRELEGAYRRLCAHVELVNRPLTLDTAKQIDKPVAVIKRAINHTKQKDWEPIKQEFEQVENILIAVGEAEG